MPLHDWTKIYPGLYHDFHQGWTVNLSAALNKGLLPNKKFSMLAKKEEY